MKVTIARPLGRDIEYFPISPYKYCDFIPELDFINLTEY